MVFNEWMGLIVILEWQWLHQFSVWIDSLIIIIIYAIRLFFFHWKWLDLMIDINAFDKSLVEMNDFHKIRILMKLKFHEIGIVFWKRWFMFYLILLCLNRFYNYNLWKFIFSFIHGVQKLTLKVSAIIDKLL